MYSFLENNTYNNGIYSIVPIRFEDRFLIKKWRNEQIYHLRQVRLLTDDDQEKYFANVIAKLFDASKPSQILFSYLQDGKCIGYGGLVHINWVDGHAEISFLMDTELEKNEFSFHWNSFLGLIENIAFKEFNFNKIFTYAFDVRPHLYNALEKSGYSKEAVLKNHVFIEGKYVDVIIHSKFISRPYTKEVLNSDCELLFNWANNPLVRKYSKNTNPILWENHVSWLDSKLSSQDCIYLLLIDEGIAVGSIRFDKSSDNSLLISYLIEPRLHGRGYGTKILDLGITAATKRFGASVVLHAWVSNENMASIKIFEKFEFKRIQEKNNSFLYQMIGYEYSR